jgi:hypothetical protein
MDVKQALAAAPLIRSVWRRVPGALKIPLVIVAVIVWYVRRNDVDPQTTSA